MGVGQVTNIPLLLAENGVEAVKRSDASDEPSPWVLPVGVNSCL